MPKIRLTPCEKVSDVNEVESIGFEYGCFSYLERNNIELNDNILLLINISKEAIKSSVWPFSTRENMETLFKTIMKERI